MSDTISISEAAISLGLSRQAVYKKLDNEFKPYLQNVNGKKRLKKAVLEKNIKNEMSSEFTGNFTKIVNLLTTQNEQLNRELEVKNAQIQELQEQNKELTIALSNATEGIKAAQTLQAASMKLIPETSEKKKFSLFRRKTK